MVDINKKYQTRDGMPVRLLAMDAKGTYPVIGLVDVGNAEYSRQWTEDGKADFRGYVKTNYDLVEVEKGVDDVR